MLATEITNAGLAGFIGLSERRVATVKAEGRLPLTPSGRIDLAELVRRGWAATVAPKGQPAAYPEPTAEQRAESGALGPVLDFTEPHDRGFAVAALLALREAPICAALAAADAGTPRAQPERLADMLVVLLWGALNRQACSMGLPDSGTGGPIYSEGNMLTWREVVNWPGLFDAEGRSIVAEKMRANCEEAPGA